ncbi:disease resistance protein RPV1 [Cryptomeria japonica]|uniref:disease resistance protein RPV1 n=1 Tax=Cryptomeria japonica TaxID=3369 RepID=UPI0027D9EB19|nr:disease resistance protein RPV1 [Cryptomeria japonica]
MASATPPVTPAQIIDQVLKAGISTPEYLQQLVTNIDTLLDQYTNKGKQKATNDKLASAQAGLPSPSHVAAFSEEASKNVKLISDQISKSSGDKHDTTISVLNALGNVHWVGVGFLLVAAVIERLDKIKANKKECLGLLKSMNDLAKQILQLQRLPHLKEEMQDKMKESIHLIVDGVILCYVQQKKKRLVRLLVAGTDGEELAHLRNQVDEMCRTLHSQMSLSTLDVVHINIARSQPPVPFHNSTVVGIDHKITEVIQLLEWDNDNPVVAVIVHGIGGAGKTTLANQVFASLNLQAWKYSKVTVVKNLESNPNIEEIQSEILSDLTGIKHDKVRDFQDGQQKLKSIMEKEVVFIYIDNILKREHLEHLIPKLIDSPKKVRILVTARKTNVSGVFESCRFKPCKLYAIESLSVEASLEILFRKIDTERYIDSMVEERPQAREIAKKCSCCPLFLEVVGAYLHKRNNKVEAYEKVVGWLSDGNDFSCDKEDSFEESRILFAYHELAPSAQEAFLDICSFFYDWEWNEVACIVGEEELDCLLEGALVKRVKDESNPDESYHLSIHDLILTAGRNKSKGNRYTSEDDISMAIESEGDLAQTKGVWLKYNRKPFHVSAELLDTMSRSLRVLGMDSNTIVSGQCGKRFDELRFLQAWKVPNLAIDMLKLKNLRFMDCCFQENEIWSLPMHFSGLQVLKLRKIRRTDIQAEIEFGHLAKLKHLELEGFHNKEILSFVKVYGLQKLKLSSIEGLKELPGTIGKLGSLQKLHVSSCDDLMRLEEGFGELSSLVVFELTNSRSLQELTCDFKKLLSLQSLNLSYCPNLLRLPEEIENLPSLKFVNVKGCSMLTSMSNRVCELSFWQNRISLDGCKSLKALPIGFGQFSYLESLCLDKCESLQELCDGFHCLAGLKILKMYGCKSLSRLPEGFGQLGCLENLYLSGCDKIQELCSDFGCLGALKYLHLSKCKSLSRLPEGFGELGCLEKLYLSGCDKIQELCSDFGCLGALKDLHLSQCKSLSRLPEGFGQLGCLENLYLSGCDKIQELCSDFGCLGALKHLDLSECKSLFKLPDCFSQLGSLDTLDLSMCCKLEELSCDFHGLTSLIKLDLSNCESLGENWVDNVGSIQRLWRLNISRSERMIRRWIKMQKEKEDLNFVVITGSSWEETEEGRKALLLKAVTSKIFNEEGLMIDIHGRPFYSSSLPLVSSLIFIIDVAEHSSRQIDGNLFEKGMRQLEMNSRACSILYAGRHFSALPSEVTKRIVAYTPPSSKTSVFFDKVSATFPKISGRQTSVFRGRVGLEVKEIKCPSVWEDVSYILNESAFLSRAPSESNVEILRAILQSDFLLKKNQQVKLVDLQGKVILLLHTKLVMRQGRYSAFNDFYMKIQSSHHNLVEVISVPYCHEMDKEEFERVAADVPWPVVPNPWFIQPSLRHFFSLSEVPNNSSSWSPTVMVLDGKGRISNKNAWEMISRWGEESFPFSQDREAELRKSEWEKMCNYNQFVFRSLPFTPTEVKEGLACGEIMLLFVGRAPDMLKFSAEVEYALTKLKSHFQLYYIRRKYPFKEWGTSDVTREYNIPYISCNEGYRFWEHMKYLYNDLRKMGSDEKVVKMRNMVCGIISAEVGSERDKEIRVIVVDEKGKMVSGRGKEVVEALLQFVENDSKLPSEVKMGGIRAVLEGQRKDGIIHSKHHPHHIMLQICKLYARPRCSLCFKKTKYYYYQCNVCENHVMCEECIVATSVGRPHFYNTS